MNAAARATSQWVLESVPAHAWGEIEAETQRAEEMGARQQTMFVLWDVLEYFNRISTP